MKKNWKDSFKKCWFDWNNGKLEEDGAFGFDVTFNQGVYLKGRTTQIAEMCQEVIGMTPHTIKFNKEWDEFTDEIYYVCVCYFGEEFVVNPNVDTEEGLMDVYHKKGSDFSVGAKKYLNGDYSNNGTEVELYTIGSDWKPKFFIRISSKDGSELTDDIIKSHIEIFYSQKEAI